MRSRDRRFVGKARAWQIQCGQCSALSKVVGSAGRNQLPPEVVIKKLMQAGWKVADNSKHDLCPECIRRPIKGRVVAAAKVLGDAMAPMVNINGDHRIHFTELKAAAAQLDPKHAKELIEELKKQIPPKCPKQPKPEPPPKMEGSDYEKWLNEQEANHQRGLRS